MSNIDPLADEQAAGEPHRDDPQQPAGDPSPHGGQEVADKVNEAAAKGYFGHRPDDTPHENYTLPGVIAGKPTPENEKE